MEKCICRVVGRKICACISKYFLIVLLVIFTVALVLAFRDKWYLAELGDPYVLVQDYLILIGAVFAWQQLSDARKAVKAKSYLNACKYVDDEECNAAYGIVYANRDVFERTEIAHCGMGGVQIELQNAARFLLYRVEKLAIFTKNNCTGQLEVIEYVGDVVINVAHILRFVILYYQQIDRTAFSEIKLLSDIALENDWTIAQSEQLIPAVSPQQFRKGFTS